MNKSVLLIGGSMAFCTLVSLPAAAQTRSPWEMHDGLEVTPEQPLGLIPFTCAPVIHGDVCEYDVATVPLEADPGWGPAPDPDIIDFTVFPSRVCEAPINCLGYGDFTYFQTFVDIPADVSVTAFTITFNGMDDGSRVSIYNSVVPDGLVIPGSFVFLGGTGTTDLASFVVSGEVNRIVITQVDDCCIENNLREARVVLNGEVIDTGCDSDAECDDGNPCSDDICNGDGSCSNPPLSCDDGNACTNDVCDPAVGCVIETIACDDSNMCTADACDPALGCMSEPISCDDHNACTAEMCDPASGCASAPISCDDGDRCTVDSCDPVAGCKHEKKKGCGRHHGHHQGHHHGHHGGHHHGHHGHASHNSCSN